MATRSIIAAKQDNGTFKAIYCHWDGFVQGVGKILFDHYKDKKMVNQLLSLGHISALGIKPIEDPNGWDYKKRNTDLTVTYKSRGDKGVEPEILRGKKRACVTQYGGKMGAEFIYLFENNKWYVQCGMSIFKPLEDKIAMVNRT